MIMLFCKKKNNNILTFKSYHRHGILRAEGTVQWKNKKNIAKVFFYYIMCDMKFCQLYFKAKTFDL